MQPCWPAAPPPRPLPLGVHAWGAGAPWTLRGRPVSRKTWEEDNLPLSGPFSVCEVMIVAWPGPSSPCVVSMETDSELAPPSL